jgi:2-oxoglutarate dehydrogenase E1 component
MHSLARWASRTSVRAAAVRHRRPFYHDAVASGPNALYLESIYTQWKADPSKLDPKWNEYFAALEAGESKAVPASGSAMRAASLDAQLTAPREGGSASLGYKLRGGAAMDGGGAIQSLIRAYQVQGHKAANVDPLGLHQWRKWDKASQTGGEDLPELDPKFHGFTEADLDKPVGVGFGGLPKTATLKDIVATLNQTYCGTVGIEYMHIGDVPKLDWIRAKVESPDFIPKDKAKLLKVYEQLCEADTFEQFLNNKYKTTKRFGVDGAEAAIAGINAAIERSAEMGVNQCVIGMPHRGRLNILTNVVAKPLVQMFAEFKGTHYDFDKLLEASETEDWLYAGDVKYHLGTSNVRTFEKGQQVTVTLEANPSHLETVNTVTLGRTRAKQYYLGNTDESRKRVLPVLFHGDASFAGQGVVYETMQLAHVREFDVGGTIHVIVNNQVGFTTDPIDDRSTMYSTDLGKAFNAPILHVNADDPVGVVSAFELAAEWRQNFGTDVVMDVVGYRRYGHNETDAPEYTQPILYKQIAKHPRSEAVYAQKLISSGVASQAEIDAVKDKLWKKHEESFEAADGYQEGDEKWVATKWEGFARPTDPSTRDPTGVDLGLLRKIGEGLSTVPDGFKPHPGLKRQLAKKKQDLDEGKTIDWATAEALAFGSLLLEGNHVRITGQDVQRGTFAHRHCVIKDQADGSDYCFLNNLNLGPQETFIARNSILAEYAVLGFELGFTYENPKALVIWEAQFGDFANTAQVMTDQFISAGEHKWLQQSGLVMLLPHGYMGQGAEHSSCRLERFLQLSDDDEDDIPSFENDFGRSQVQKANWQVMNISTPANYFHALRRQQHRNFRKPMVLASPKNLFRLRECVSPLEDMGPDSGFKRLMFERDPTIEPEKVDRLIFCSGKLYYELVAEREKHGLKNVAILTMEQIAPFPFDRVKAALEMYPNVDKGDGVHPGNIIWCQEEPKNMGAWSYVRPRLVTTAREGLDADVVFRYIGRRAAASPATGYPKLHAAEQAEITRQAVLGAGDYGGDSSTQRPSSLLGFQT